MNIIEAANILNIRHDADHMVVKAAFHALAKRNHPDMGGDTATMQRINEAHNYMSTRTQQARLAEWERLQPKPAHQPERQSWRVGQFDEYVATKMAEKANKAATSSHNPEPLRPGYTTRPWKPAPQSLRKRFHSWRRHQPWLVRWLLNLSIFLLVMAGRLAVVTGMFYSFAESVRWAIKSLAHGAWVLLIIFPGIMVILAGFMVTGIVALNFLHGGWKGLGNYFMDRGPAHEGITIPSDAWTRKAAHTGGRTRWI
ncbi:MAG: J domain-containing protein [Acidithiobacillus ferrivorans]